MRYLVLSDIHANLEALEATLAAAGAYDSTLVLGDLVGYGADPNAVIECVRGLQPAVVIRGNHDKVAAGLEGVEGFNQIAREAIEWTSDALTAENRAWLAALPQGPIVIDDTVEICHGSPFDEDMSSTTSTRCVPFERHAARCACSGTRTFQPYSVFQAKPLSRTVSRRAAR